ncbi:MAG TPA: DPP IV N-terminal domain-containing protein [Oleiagrimonas sp.]|nr:DPP IV N-terminal domain-containing protein [Oleiagrimonas sp.]
MATQLTPQDYRDALTLRDRWKYLTRDVAFPAHWVGKTHDFVYRKTVEGGFAFIRENADTGAKTRAFDQAGVARALGAARDAQYDALRLPFKTFTYANDGQSIDFDIHYVGWRCAVDGSHCVKRPRTHRPRGFGVVRDLRYPANNTPHVSPDGRWEAFVKDHDLVVRSRATGETRMLSHDGSAKDFYDPESIHWSPDSKKLVIYQVKPGYARFVTRVLSAPDDQLQPEVRKQLYPKPGDRVDIEQPVLFHVQSGEAIHVDTTLFPNPYKLRDLHWRADSRTFAFEYDQRGFQHVRIIEVDADTGAARVQLSEDADTFVNVLFGGVYWHDVGGLGKQIIWMSERDGWQHLYLIDGDTGKVINQITHGDWVVRKVLHVDDAKRQIWFAANGMDPDEDPYYVHVYRINFDGTGLTPLTPVRAYHDVAFSHDMKYYVDTYSRVDLPNVAELHRTADGSLVRTIATGDISRLLAAGYKPPQSFVAKGRDGKTDIWGMIVKPKDFDPDKQYRVIENIYAGPHSSFVPKKFWPFGYHSSGDEIIGMQAQANLGFIVVQIDGMGTAHRSKAFHDVAWKDLADAGFPDRILWHKAAAAKFPWYDIKGGVGIYGASAGGQNAMAALLFHPDFYTVAVAYAGCYDNRMDKISWNEQWMGWPVDASYAKSSDVVNAWRLKGRLLLIFGEQDSNVDPSSTLQVVDALIKAHKDFDLLEVPGGGHTVGRSTGPIYYVERRQFGFFAHYLLGQKVPDWNRLAPATKSHVSAENM